MITVAIIALSLALTLSTQYIPSLQSFYSMEIPHNPSHGHITTQTYNEYADRQDMLFVGDIMLGRAVERIMNLHGVAYPYDALGRFLSARHTTVGNFEAAMPKTHEPTADFSVQFSVSEAAFGAAVDAGFDLFSLANNHALDFGTAGYQHTRTRCTQYRVRCIGHPSNIDTVAVHYSVINTMTVATIALHLLPEQVPYASIESLLEQVKQKSDFQIAYIHWGTEYEKTHSPRQASIAHWLIDAGIDTIIGHHPHVVQDIALYKGVPIFYSLGNFIFDQYFDEAVQTGLAVVLTFTKTHVHYALHPVESTTTRAQPRLMHGAERAAFLDTLQTSSKYASSTIISQGTFTIPYRY